MPRAALILERKRQQQTDSILSSGAALPAEQATILHRTLLLLLQLYYDLNSQDLPEFFEDRLAQFMPLLLKYLDYTPAGAAAAAPADEDEDDEEMGDLEAAKAEICEIAQLYSLRYLDAFGEGGYLGPFVEKTWGLLTKLGPAVKYDTVSAPVVREPAPFTGHLRGRMHAARGQGHRIPRHRRQDAVPETPL